MAGCGPGHISHPKVDMPVTKPYITKAGDKIVFMDDYYSNYLKLVRRGVKNKDSLFKEMVLAPMHDKYFLENGLSPDQNPGSLVSKGDTIGLDSVIGVIETSKTYIEQKVASALADCRGYLKNDSITIYIGVADKGMHKVVRTMGGINSWTTGSKVINIIIDAKTSGWMDMLQYCVAREYNHAFSWEKMHQGAILAMDLLDRIIAEGKADAYSHLLYPDVKCAWDTALSDDGIKYQWSRMKMEMRSEDYYMIQGIMFGSDNYPMWTGYNVGLAIVQSALKNNPTLTPSNGQT